MQSSNVRRASFGLVAGSVAVALFAGSRDAEARGAGIRVVDCSIVSGQADVEQNRFFSIVFSSPVDPAYVNPAIFQIRQRNASGTGYTKQVPGSFQIDGRVVRFYPRLSTHLRDPDSPVNDFYNPGTPRDDAEANAGLQPSTSYEILVLGGRRVDAVRSSRGRRMGRSFTRRFSTSPKSPKTLSYTIETYGDAPPPRFEFSNPSDKVASVVDQYARHGGTKDVPNGISVTLFGNRVPVSVPTLRKTGNVTLTLTERNGDPSFTKPIRGTPFVEQNFDGTRIVYRPFFPLPDRGTYALRVAKDVRDLTEVYDFRSNDERLRLREIYESLATAQALSPSTPPEFLPDPAPALIFDWPTDSAARGVFKANILALGGAYPYEVDPRVMVLFSTRDEPISDGSIVLEFLRSDGYYDPVHSTASYDDLYPGAASAVLTIAAGSGVNGDYSPTQSETIDVDGYANGTVNWRKVNIPPNVTVTITGSRPATIKCFEFTLDGTITANGQNGVAQSSTNYDNRSLQQGGKGGPGGGAGGNSATAKDKYGDAGSPGVDVDGNPAPANEGGQGGGAGQYGPTGNSTTPYYAGGGGGGGGGARLAGEAGAKASGSGSSPSWGFGTGGTGGAGSSNDDLDPFVGGAGGGSGGSGQYYYTGYAPGWALTGSSGGGGGGALLIQTSGEFTIGATGVIQSRGGSGGKGASWSAYYDAAPGGGGGGGTLLLRTTKGFNLANAGAATDVRGGARGASGGGTYSAAAYGGAGGAGYVRTEDTNGGQAGIPGASGGVFDPVGGGLPSIVYTTWIEVGVDQPRFVQYSQADFELNAAGNDAIFIEIQYAVENTQLFGTPLLDALDANGDSTNEDEVSQWQPVRIVDLTGFAQGAFGAISGYDPSIHGNDHIFPVAPEVNGRNFRFLRVRIRFQLDATQSVHEPFPFVDKMIVNFQFNI